MIDAPLDSLPFPFDCSRRSAELAYQPGVDEPWTQEDSMGWMPALDYGEGPSAVRITFEFYLLFSAH
jgi:hypothetical protein